MKLRTSLLSTAALAAAVSTGAFVDGAQAQQLTIEEITVTARKREENL